MGRFALFAILILLVLGTGCVQRTMLITSDPPGALVIMNDQEVDARASTGTVYWEGAVAADSRGVVYGRGYLELTGYGDRLRLR